MAQFRQSKQIKMRTKSICEEYQKYIQYPKALLQQKMAHILLY